MKSESQKERHLASKVRERALDKEKDSQGRRERERFRKEHYWKGTLARQKEGGWDRKFSPVSLVSAGLSGNVCHILHRANAQTWHLGKWLLAGPAWGWIVISALPTCCERSRGKRQFQACIHDPLSLMCPCQTKFEMLFWPTITSDPKQAKIMLWQV